jgi:hypothetical protein
MLEYAIWLDGRETPEARADFEEACRIAMKRAEEEAKIVTGPMTFTEKRPGEHRVPPVPRDIAGPNVRLLVAEAPVIGRKRLVIETSFLMDLDPKDLERLRAVTKAAYAKANPDANHVLSDEKADAYIESLGPDAALETLRNGTRTVH